MDNDILTPEAPVSTLPEPSASPAPPSLRESLEQSIRDTPLEDGITDDSFREEAPQPRQSRERDNTGRFARRNKDGSEFPTQEQVDKAEPNLSLDPDEPLDDPQTHEDPIPNVDNAPKSWKAVPKEKWAALDPVVRAEVHRRERDMTRAVNEHAPVKKFVSEFQQAIQPFANHYAPRGITPLQLMRNLMEADVHLSTAPMPQRAQFMAKLIKDYGVDINSLDMALAGQDPTTNPSARFEALLDERLAPVQGFIQNETQRRQSVIQAEQQRAATVLERMEADAVNFPHMKLVKQDMADVMELGVRRGVYLTPAQAYARAVALNPEAQAAEQGRAGQQRATQAHDAATRSLGASLSVSGSPAGVKQPVPPSDLRGTIEAAWEAAQGR